MKFVWICLAILCALASVCGAGLYVWGWSFYQKTEHLDAEAAAYSDDVARGIASEWRADALQANLDSADSKQDPMKLVEQGRPLGSLVSMTKFIPVQSVWRPEVEGRRQVVTSISHTVFAHGHELITIKATKLDSGWRVLTFEIHPETAQKP